MKFKLLVTFGCILFVIKVTANTPNQQLELSNISTTEIINTDSLIQSVFSKSNSNPTPKIEIPVKSDSIKENKPNNALLKKTSDELSVSTYDTVAPFYMPINITPVKVDSFLLLGNPFFIELVFKGLPFKFNWETSTDYRTLFYGSKAKTLSEGAFKTINKENADQIIMDLRRDAREQITRKAAYLYVFTFDQLPDPEANRNHYIENKFNRKIHFVNDNDFNPYRRKLIVHGEQLGPWQHKVNALAQFSQNYVSPNWYQGGNSNLSVLGILSGQLTYDNKKYIQWENYAEWRMGFNTVAGDSLRMLSTNDDIFKINSKLGIKAGGNFFYSGYVDFSTQFFNSYNGINSTVMKTSFLTPVRLNIGVGLDYKYKKIFSMMLAPISYKYIFVSNYLNVNPNLFGIKTGDTFLSEVGSSFKAILCYPVTKEIQLNSNLSFYTNYQKVEVDWELVCNMTINRFMSTRISFNPRYDNTVIETDGSKARMQFKQLLSVGFSHRFN